MSRPSYCHCWRRAPQLNARDFNNAGRDIEIAFDKLATLHGIPLANVEITPERIAFDGAPAEAIDTGERVIEFGKAQRFVLDRILPDDSVARRLDNARLCFEGCDTRGLAYDANVAVALAILFHHLNPDRRASHAFLIACQGGPEAITQARQLAGHLLECSLREMPPMETDEAAV